MGQLVIEVPQNINLKLSVKSAELADEILRLAKNPTTKKKLETITLDLPYDDLDDIDEKEVLGIWSDREEEAVEIARRVREQNRKIT